MGSGVGSSSSDEQAAKKIKPGTIITVRKTFKNPENVFIVQKF
jgi:hypothetical protein